LFEVGDDFFGWEQDAGWVTLAQGAVGGILHDEERSAVLYAKIEDGDDVWVFQVGDDAGFVAELLDVFAGDLRFEDFDGGKGAKVDVFSEEDFSKAALPDELGKLIVAKLLTYETCHT